MCGRVYIKSTLEGLMRAFSFARSEGVQGLANQFPRYNGAPTQTYPIIIRDVIREPDLFGPVFVSARWGLIPRWARDAKGGGRPPPINVRCETISTNGLFKAAYRSRRCLVPIDGFFEWKDIYGNGKNKQPYAIALKSGAPFALAGIWEYWRDPQTGEDIRSFAIITCEPNEMMAVIHDRMPVLLQSEDYQRWISSAEDPHDLLKPFPAGQMAMWKIGRNVGTPKNDSPDIIKEIDPEETELL
jgi:putative SOS response-associated peptidase YedK